VTGIEGNRGDLVIYFSGSHWDGPPGHDRHMAEALSQHHPVLFVEPTISVLTRVLRPDLGGLLQGPALRILNPRLAHLVTAVVPGFTRLGLHLTVAPTVRRAVRRAVRRLYGPHDRTPVAGLVTSRVEDFGWPLPARRVLFYATDDLVAGADMLGLPRDRLLAKEARMLRRADAVAVVSPALRDRYAHDGIDAELVPNGCEAAVYSDVDSVPPAADVHLPGPVAGLFGHINDRIDMALLEAVAEANCSLLIVGPLARGYQPERFHALIRRPNVCWVGQRPHQEMPSYLRLIDVGLTPYADNAFNRASFPLKTLEYLSAGRPVVATPLPANDWLGTDLINIAAGPRQYAARVLQALTQVRTPELMARRRAFAERHSWQRRAERIAALLGLSQPSDASRPAVATQPTAVTPAPAE
jgi:teichuronic acid biosynthesis glycosyltransferase TuaH